MIITATTMIIGGFTGLLLSPQLARLTGRTSRWFDRRLVAGMAMVSAVGAAGVADGWAELVCFVLLAIGAALLVAVDLAAHRLPDVLVGPLYLVLISGLIIAAAPAQQWQRLITSLVAGAVLLIGYFVLGLLSRGRLGLGDVKLAGLLGIFLGWIGWAETAFGVLAGFGLGAVVAVGMLTVGRAAAGSELPFGPCMIGGAVLGVALGPAVLPALA